MGYGEGCSLSETGSLGRVVSRGVERPVAAIQSSYCGELQDRPGRPVRKLLTV